VRLKCLWSVRLKNIEKGENKMRAKRLLISIIMAMVLVIGLVLPVFATSATADVTITATPEYLAMTNSEADWTIGGVATNTTKWWTASGNAPAEPFVANDMKSTVTNIGSVISDVKIHGHDFTSTPPSWTLDVDGSPGADSISIKYGITGLDLIANMTYLTKSDVEIMDSLAATDGACKWCMSLLTGTSFTAGEAQSGVVTLTIFKHV
jgi:hypothetical protein